jgi:phospholipase/carboxylesterase
VYHTTAVVGFLLCSVWLSSGKALAQGGGPDRLLCKWQRAYFDEIHGSFDSAIADYQTVMQRSTALPPRLQEWYLGTCNFAIARAYSIMGDGESARTALDSALHHHFWNFSAIRNVPTFSLLFSDRWVDSVCTEWNSLRDRESTSWSPQPMIILEPKNPDPNKKYPVIIALHGGNGSYELFANRLHRVPDALEAIVVVVPGVLRVSEYANAWDSTVDVSEPRVREAIETVAVNRHANTKDITLLGFSQGAQLSYSYCVDHPDEIRNVITFSGFAPKAAGEKAFESNLENAANHKIKIIAVSGSDDSPDFLNSTRDLQTRAQKIGMQFDFRIDPTLPHGMPRHISKYLKRLWAELRGESIGAN